MSPSNARHRLSFNGTTSEYFLVWLVNVALTIITLGLYGPWAKVRREKFFYNHTQLEGASFDYLANPLKILKGRLIVFGSFFLIVLIGSLFPLLQVITFLIILAITPWLITTTLKFRARYSSYRNLHFVFAGKSTLTFLYFLVWKFLGVISLGLLLPLAKFKEREYLVNSLRYAGKRFQFSATVESFYWCYVKYGLLAISPLLLAVIVFIARSFIGVFFGGEPTLTSPGPGSSPDAEERIAQATEAILAQLEGSAGAVIMVAAGIAAILLTPLLLQVLRGAIARLTWNNVTIGSFTCYYTIHVGRYAWIVISNRILQFLTLGIATPFCAVRLYRYKVENLALEGPSDLSEFVATAKEELSAIGDQASDIYDVDIDVGL